MKLIFVSTILILLTSCEQDPKKVNNPATRYVESLQGDVKKADATADKASELIHKQEADFNQIANQE